MLTKLYRFLKIEKNALSLHPNGHGRFVLALKSTQPPPLSPSFSLLSLLLNVSVSVSDVESCLVHHCRPTRSCQPRFVENRPLEIHCKVINSFLYLKKATVFTFLRPNFVLLLNILKFFRFTSMILVCIFL